MREPDTILTPMIYYSITLFRDATKSGYQFSSVWKTEKAAYRNARDLFNTGNFDLVVLRKNDVKLRDENHEYSTSGVVTIWKKQGISPAVVPAT